MVTCLILSSRLLCIRRSGLEEIGYSGGRGHGGLVEERDDVEGLVLRRMLAAIQQCQPNLLTRNMLLMKGFMGVVRRWMCRQWVQRPLEKLFVLLLAAGYDSR
jgi:hypothetical protein